jgi:hypothetical protein
VGWGPFDGEVAVDCAGIFAVLGTALAEHLGCRGGVARVQPEWRVCPRDVQLRRVRFLHGGRGRGGGDTIDGMESQGLMAR